MRLCALNCEACPYPKKNYDIRVLSFADRTRGQHETQVSVDGKGLSYYPFVCDNASLSCSRIPGAYLQVIKKKN